MTTLAQHRYTQQLAHWKLPAVLFLLSFATVVFTIALFRLLTLFIMPSLFFRPVRRSGRLSFTEVMFPLLGATRLLGIPFLLVALAMLMLAPPLRVRRILLLQQLVVFALLLAPQLEGGFLKLYSGGSIPDQDLSGMSVRYSPPAQHERQDQHIPEASVFHSPAPHHTGRSVMVFNDQLS